MTREAVRMDVLDLLARGKISIDEAVVLLDEIAASPKSDVSGREKESSPGNKGHGSEMAIEPEVRAEENGLERVDKEPRWLRISVADLETGASKVRVNLPMAMVKFGLSVAQLLAPDDKSGNWVRFDDLLSATDTGVLIDVQDDESKEHVRISFE